MKIFEKWFLFSFHPLMFNCRFIFSSWCTRFTNPFARTRPESMRDIFQITRWWALKYISYIYIWSLHYCFMICLNTLCLISQSEASRVLECPSYKFLSVHRLDLLNSPATLANKQRIAGYKLPIRIPHQLVEFIWAVCFFDAQRADKASY